VIIAIDAASTDLSLALLDPGGGPIGDDAWSSGQRQSSELLPRLLGLLDRHRKVLGDASAVAVGTGPGSFTGLRVSMALAKGLALALDRPIVGVPSLEAWLEAEPEAMAAVARAGAREAYVQLRDEPEPMIAEREPLAERIAERRVVAAGELAAAFGLRSAVPPRAAAAIGRAASVRLAVDPAGDDLHRLEPRYLRAPRGVDVESQAAVRWL
jgi:tRNA threonylcarbamoyladenosine biosynthesis protein TsaB